MTRRGWSIRVTNVLVHSEMNTVMRLHDIALSTANVIYDPVRINAVHMRHRQIEGVASIFESGHMSVNGCSSVRAAGVSVRRFARLMQKKNPYVRLSDVRVASISALVSCDRKIFIDLASIDRAAYDSCRHAAAFLKVFGVCYMIYRSGKVIVTGLRNSKSTWRAVEETLEYLEKFCVEVEY